MQSPLPLQFVTAIPLLLLTGCVQHEMQKTFPMDAEFTSETISSLVLRNGQEVQFGKEGGRYGAACTITGVTDSGNAVSFKSSQLAEARLASPPFITSAPTGDEKIAEAVLTDGRFFQFDSMRATVDVNKGWVTGRLVNGRRSELSIPAIRRYRTNSAPASNITTLARRPEVRISEVVLRETPGVRGCTLIVFNTDGGRVTDPQEVIEGIPVKGPLGPYPIDSILYAEIERVNAAGTVLATFGGLAAVAGVVALIVAATKESCPFVYSYDGARYVFDGEPLGGATSEVLARTDFSRMEHLRPVRGMYRLLVRNEVAETQYIDAVQLLVVDHQNGQTPVLDALGQAELVRTMTPPLGATDENGTNILPLIREMDGVAWQTHLESVSQTEPGSLRHTLTFTFPRPPGARRARIVARVGTTLWGSAMIRYLYDLRGDAVEQWHTAVDREGPELFELMKFVEREELFSLRILIRRGESWVHRGYLAGGGPFVHETQIQPLSLTGATGDSLTIRVRPPLGFWSVDYIGIEYDPGPGARAATIPLGRAVDQDGRDVTPILHTEDRSYSVMPTTKHWTALEFVAPPTAPGMQRTVFLRTSGYYRLHLAQEEPQDTATLNDIYNTPGSVIRYSLEKYRDWYEAVRMLPVPERRAAAR